MWFFFQAAAVVVAEIFVNSKIWEVDVETASLRDSLLRLEESLLSDETASLRRHGLIVFDHLVKVSK